MTRFPVPPVADREARSRRWLRSASGQRVLFGAVAAALTAAALFVQFRGPAGSGPPRGLALDLHGAVVMSVPATGPASTGTTTATTTPPATATTTATTTAVDPSSAEPPTSEQQTWTRLEVQAQDLSHGRTASLAAVTTVPSGGDVAVGGDGLHPLVLASSDGRTWIRLGHQPGSGLSDVPGALRDAVADDHRLVVVGTAAGQPAVWDSNDGNTWTRLSFAGATDRVVLSSVATAGAHLVVAGYDPNGAGLWTIDDQRVVPVPVEDVEGASPGAQSISDVTGGDAGLVASGNDAQGRPMLWRSSDATSWRAYPLSDDRGVATAATFGANRWVAVGYDASGGAAWWSEDGTTWRHASAAVGDQRPQTVAGIATFDGGFVAVGHESDTPLCWRSQQGDAWAACGPAPATDSSGVAEGVVARGRTAIAVGAVFSGSNATPTIWVLDLP